ncbi:MAG: hypothetical protein QM765_40810 [Myxococcales bacterium]
MRRSVIAVVTVSAALIGAGVWYLFADSAQSGVEAPAPPSSPAPTASVRREARPTESLFPTGRAEAPAEAVVAPAAPDASGPSPEELAGPERKPPRQLATRFTEPVVKEAVATALKEADSRGASIVNVDCTEHPCIVYVDNVQPYDSKNIFKAPSLAAYKGESAFTACFPTVKSEGTGAGVCAFAVEPKLAQGDHQAALKRFRYRVEQMRDATR